MKISIIQISPHTKVWGFSRIRNVVANGRTRGLSLYIGTLQFALELRPKEGIS